MTKSFYFLVDMRQENVTAIQRRRPKYTLRLNFRPEDLSGKVYLHPRRQRDTDTTPLTKNIDNLNVKLDMPNFPLRCDL